MSKFRGFEAWGSGLEAFDSGVQGLGVQGLVVPRVARPTVEGLAFWPDGLTLSGWRLHYSICVKLASGARCE